MLLCWCQVASSSQGWCLDTKRPSHLESPINTRRISSGGSSETMNPSTGNETQEPSGWEVTALTTGPPCHLYDDFENLFKVLQAKDVHSVSTLLIHYTWSRTKTKQDTDCYPVALLPWRSALSHLAADSPVMFTVSVCCYKCKCWAGRFLKAFS